MSKRATEVTPEAIISLMEKLTQAANTQLWIKLLDRPDLRPGIMPVPANLVRSMYELACKALAAQESEDKTIRGWREVVDWLSMCLRKQGNGPRAKKEKTDERHKLIDELISAERALGVPPGGEDWRKIRDRLREGENGKLIQGQNDKEMTPASIEKQYLKARPDYQKARRQFRKTHRRHLPNCN